MQDGPSLGAQMCSGWFGLVMEQSSLDLMSRLLQHPGSLQVPSSHLLPTHGDWLQRLALGTGRWVSWAKGSRVDICTVKALDAF